MAAFAAARGSNPMIAGFYERLRLAGKPAKLALTACMRKLILTLNAGRTHEISVINAQGAVGEDTGRPRALKVGELGSRFPIAIAV